MKTAKIVVLFFYFLVPGYAQTDSTEFSMDTTFNKVDVQKLESASQKRENNSDKSWLRRNPAKAFVAPVVLVGMGAALIQNPIYDRFDFRNDLRSTFPRFKRTKVDDFLIYTPYVGLVTLNLLKINCQNDFINTSLIILKSEIINLALMYSLKVITNIDRPNGERLAWPSGHTSEAFLAATIVNREFRYRSPWYGIAAYSVAGTVGLFRMLNNKHWLSDVVAGAGIGIFSANLTYITHKWRWGKPGTCFFPTYNSGNLGFVMVYHL